MASSRTTSTRILCIGDLHLGRTPTGVAVSGEQPAGFGPREVLRRCCKFAESQNVDAVVFTGDIVDAKNAFFEAYGALSTSIASLLAADIPVFAIAGNHDFDVLPRLAAEVPAFKLLGADGIWEKVLLEPRERPAVRILGVSFTEREHPENPLDTFPAHSGATPTVAILHCDVDATHSVYAPVRLNELISAGPDAWLLGHIHKPQILSTQPLILYPGSPQGLDPGEPGMHGPWLISIDNDGMFSHSQIPLNTLRYETIEVSISDIECADEVLPQIIREVRSFHEANLDERTTTSLISVRLLITGETDIPERELTRLADGICQEEVPESGVRYVFEKVVLQCRPKISLRQLAEGNDPVSLLAQRIELLSAREPRERYDELMGSAINRCTQIASQPAYASLSKRGTSLTEEALRDSMLASAWSLLRELIDQARESK